MDFFFLNTNALFLVQDPLLKLLLYLFFMTFDNLRSYFAECRLTGLWVFRNTAEVTCSHLVKSGSSSSVEGSPEQSQHSPPSMSDLLEAQSAAHTQGKGKLSSTYRKGSICIWNSYRWVSSFTKITFASSNNPLVHVPCGTLTLSTTWSHWVLGDGYKLPESKTF